MKPYTCNLTIFIGCIIIDSFCGITAAGVNSFFVEVADFYASLLLCHGTKNVKRLADTGGLGILGDGIDFCESSFYKA